MSTSDRPRKSHHRPTEATRADVRARAGAGEPTAKIAAAYGLSSTGLRAHYRDELGRSIHTPSVEVRTRILAAVKAGHSIAEIVAAVGLSREVLFRCYRNEISPAVSGRPRVITPCRERQ